MTMKTDNNLKQAFSGESQANRMYIAFAKQADKEGFVHIAKLFRAAAEAETVHAINHFRTMKRIESTLDNLRTAHKGEVYEYNEMYPDFIKNAEIEKREDAKITFLYANKVEKEHAKLFQEASESIQTGKDLPSSDYFVCQTCGFTIKGEAPEKCPICGSLRDRFKLTT